MAPSLTAPADRPQQAPIILTESQVEQALANRGNIAAPATQSLSTDLDRRPGELHPHPENSRPAPSKTSCKFKRQIKLFEKLESQMHRPCAEPLGLEDEDKPTFFFGAFARAQLVAPIEGDSHFDGWASSTDRLPSKQGEAPDITAKLATLLPQSEDRDSKVKSTTTFHIEEQKAAPGENRYQRIEIRSRGENMPETHTLAAPERAPLRRVD